GMPQIEVTFDMDANGILHVSAKDKETGKEQRIEIKAGSGLSEEEIEKMVTDAEAHREEDKRFHELVTTRNSAEALAHSTRSMLKEQEDKIDDATRKPVEDAIEQVEEAIKGDDKDAIDTAVNGLQEASTALYQAAAQADGGAEAAEGGASGDSEASGESAEDVVDAEFTEVDDEDKK
ncbi:MAG TPA: Hsp70 family protein, partial [Wenzhouxiangellaceae bacterium]|nr:Hsp70 family protein [Wenzhouxiangellaceae bacterium]